MSFFAHPQAIIESKQIGLETKIWAFSHVQETAVIGGFCNIGEHCFIEHGSRIGNRVTIKNGVCIWEGIEIEDDVFIGPNAAFTNDHRPRSPRAEWAKTKYENVNWLAKILLEKGCTVGANTTVVGPVKLGKFCFIGAGTVVIHNVPPFALVVGNPGKQIGWVNEMGERADSPPTNHE